MAALQIKNIPWGAGDDFKIDASYAKGDTKNVISTSSASPNICDVRRSAAVRLVRIRASALVRCRMPFFFPPVRGILPAVTGRSSDDRLWCPWCL